MPRLPYLHTVLNLSPAPISPHVQGRLYSTHWGINVGLRWHCQTSSESGCLQRCLKRCKFETCSSFILGFSLLFISALKDTLSPIYPSIHTRPFLNLHSLTTASVSCMVSYQHGSTALSMATRMGRTATVQLLLEAGVDPNRRDEVSLFSSFFCCSTCARVLHKRLFRECVKWLVYKLVYKNFVKSFIAPFAQAFLSRSCLSPLSHDGFVYGPLLLAQAWFHRAHKCCSRCTQCDCQASPGSRRWQGR